MPRPPQRPPRTPRKIPKQERARATVAAILQAATYILERRGYEGLNTNAVADKAGVNIASLYQYFPNKEAIFVELLRRHAAETRAATLAVLRARGRSSAKSTVRRMIAGIVAAHAVAPRLHRVFTEEGARLGLPPFETTSDAELAEEGARWMAGVGKKRENAPLALWIVTTAAHAVIHEAFRERPDDATSEALVDEVTKLVTRYLR
jgi:AcrR family transcriptional regulator